MSFKGVLDWFDILESAFTILLFMSSFILLERLIERIYSVDSKYLKVTVVLQLPTIYNCGKNFLNDLKIHCSFTFFVEMNWF